MPRGLYVLGACGSGKSTIARAVADKLNALYLEGDKFYDSHPSFADRVTFLEQEISQSDYFVFESSSISFAQLFEKLYDTVVFVEVPTDERIRRVEWREFEKHGQSILLGGERHEQHKEFMEKIAQYDEPNLDRRWCSREADEGWLATLNCPVTYLDGTREIDENANIVVGKVRELQAGNNNERQLGN